MTTAKIVAVPVEMEPLHEQPLCITLYLKLWVERGGERMVEEEGGLFL